MGVLKSLVYTMNDAYRVKYLAYMYKKISQNLQHFYVTFLCNVFNWNYRECYRFVFRVILSDIYPRLM